MVRNPKYRKPSAAIKVSKEALQSIWNMTADMDSSQVVDKFIQASLSVGELAPEKLDTGSGQIEGVKYLTVQSLGPITGPYGTADNTYATADADPTQPGFTGTISQQMDWRADCDPRFQFIARASPRSFGYTSGYLDGTGQAPNGEPTGTGIAFPQNPQVGDYFLRIDYMPNILYRWDGQLWVRISTNVRTDTGFGADDLSQLSGFINNQGEILINNTGEVVQQRQPLSSMLSLAPDDIPPEQ
jgi:hypothetical protein